jgi:hypothetical protein
MNPVTFSTAELRTLLVIVACGGAGALAADLVADGGRLDRWKSDEHGWTLGFLGKLIVGSIAAVVVLTLNPPEGSWSLLGSALVAGVGGEAILLAIIASRKAQSAEEKLEQTENLNSRLVALSQNRGFIMAEAQRAASERFAAPAGAIQWDGETDAPEGVARSSGEADAADAAAGTRVMAALAHGFSRESALFAAPPRDHP